MEGYRFGKVVFKAGVSTVDQFKKRYIAGHAKRHCHRPVFADYFTGLYAIHTGKVKVEQEHPARLLIIVMQLYLLLSPKDNKRTNYFTIRH